MRSFVHVFLVAFACLGASFAPLSAQVGFTVGNIVVARVGNGTAPLAAPGSPVFLDEYTPAGTFVQSIALPTTASGPQRPLILDGTAPAEGVLTRSVDGRYIVLVGYGATPGGAASLSTTLATTVNRVVGRIAGDGTIDTSTALTDFAGGGSPRSAATVDGSAFWLASSTDGVRHAAFGGTSSTSVSTTVTDLRVVEICIGQLYASTVSGGVRIGTVGTGIPTTSGQPLVNLPSFPTTGSPHGFFLVDLDAGVAGADTLYVADDAAGAMQKFALVAGAWEARGSVAAPGVHGITARNADGVLSLYGTAAGALYRFDDATGYNGAIAGAAATIATAGANTAFRGVAVTPVAPPAITAPPAAQTATAGGTATFTVTARGSEPLTYQWRKGTVNLVDAPGSVAGATTPTLTLGNLTAAAAGSYDVVVTNPVNPVTSSAAVLTVNPAPATVTLGNLFHIYNGGALPVSTVTNPAGLAVDVTYNGSPTPPSSPGSYAVVATIDDPNFTGSATGTLSIGKANAGVTLGALEQTYDGTPRVVSATTSIGAPATVTYEGSVTPPTDAGPYAVAAVIDHPLYTGFASGTLVVAKAGQSVSFVSVPSSPAAGTPLPIAANASSGLPVVISVVSGNATVADNRITFHDTALVTLRAIQAGSENVHGASAEITLTATRRAQSITFAALADTTTGAAPFGLTASATSGLAVSFVVVSGPATLNGGTLSLTGAPGAVVVRATQAGDATFEPAAPVERSFAVAAVTRVVNFSARANAGTGDQTAIVGFVLSGTEARPMLIRAIGPGLGAFGVSTALAAPRLELFRGATSLATNTGWTTAANAAEISAAAARAAAFPLAAGSADAAILTMLAPGAYTAIASSAAGAPGAALIEVYDLSAGSPVQRLSNLSARATAGSGDNTLIVGLVVAGDAPKRFLLRAAGPALAQFGVAASLARPELALRNHSGSIVAQNSGWSASPDAAAIAAAALGAGAFPFAPASADAALIATLAPGSYTAHVLGAAGSSGVALVEVYELP